MIETHNARLLTSKATTGARAGEAPMDEANLVHAARGDRSAFAVLYERYADRIYGYCLRRTDGREDAEDLTSLTFTRALTGLGEYRGGSFAAWLFAIARRAVADHLRTRVRRSTLPLDGSQAHTLAESGADPLEQVLMGEDTALVRRLIAALPDAQRDLLALRVVGRLSNAEIGQLVGTGEDTVKMRLYRTVKLLHERYRAATEPTTATTAATQCQPSAKEAPHDA